MTNTSDTRASTRPIARRHLVVGTAWLVPTITLATTAPSYAASGSAPVITVGDACKNPGFSCDVHPKGYTIPGTVCNTQDRPILITAVTYTNVQGTNLTFTYAPPPVLPLLVAANQCVAVLFNASSTDSANQAFTMNMVVTWGAPDSSLIGSVVVPINVPGTPPTCGCP